MLQCLQRLIKQISGIGRHRGHTALQRKGGCLIFFSYQCYTTGIDAKEAMCKLEPCLLSSLVIQVSDSGRGTDADDIIGILPAESSQASYQARDFSADSSTVGVSLVEDQELKWSAQKHAQIFSARQKQFKLVDVGKQETRRIGSHLFFSQAFLKGRDDDPFVLFVFLCQVFIGETPIAALQAHDTLEITLIGCGGADIHA